MLPTPPALGAVIEALRGLPGVGPRTAQRYAQHLLFRDRESAATLVAALDDALRRVTTCRDCNTLTEEPVCHTCTSSRRDRKLLCVVESPSDQYVVEQTLAFNGLYFVLMGRLSPLDGLGPQELAFDRLLRRALDGVVEEVIMATNFTQEGEATAHYLGRILRQRGLRVSRLARGVPLGGELEYVDAATVAQALRDRREA